LVGILAGHAGASGLESRDMTLTGTRLYFLRHGIAEEVRDASESDSLRPLSPQGRAALESSGRVMALLELGIDAILTSPLLRAVQTAEIIASRLGVAELVEREPLLEPGFGMHEIAEIIGARPERSRLLLVGHEPDFSRTIGRLVGSAKVVCRKGSLLRVDLHSIDPPAGELSWSIPPKLLRLLGG
jgi:phosphohistidine phosphatase